MQKLNILIFFILIISLSVGKSQNVSVKMGPANKYKNLEIGGHLYSGDEGHFMYFESNSNSQKTSDIYIHKYDADFNNVWKKKLETSSKDYIHGGMTYFNGKFSLVSLKHDIEENEINYYLTNIDFDGNLNKPLKFARIKYTTSDKLPSVVLEKTPDTSRLLFLVRQQGNKHDDFQAYYKALDYNYNTIVDHKIELPYIQKRVYITDYALGMDNSLYLIIKLYDEDYNVNSLLNSTTKKSYDYLLVRVDSVGNVKEYNIDIKNSFVDDIHIYQNKNDSKFLLAGLYSSTAKGPKEGIFYSKFDEMKGEFEFLKMRYFSEVELTNFGKNATSKNIFNSKYGLDRAFEVDNIIFKEDGSFTMILEYFSVETKRSLIYSTPDYAAYTTTYLNSNLITMDYSSEGEVELIKLIPLKHSAKVTKKRSVPPRPEKIKYDYMSYIPLVTDDRTYYLYSMAKANFTKDITDPDKFKVLKNLKKSLSVASYISDKGELVTTDIFDFEDINSILLPKFSTQINNNQVFFYSKALHTSDKYRMGIITFED